MPATRIKTPLQKVRGKRKLGQGAVAKLAGISQGYYSRVERGIETASATLAADLAKLFSREGLQEVHVLYPHRGAFRGFEPR